MTKDELKSWITERALTHKEAAALLALTVEALRERLYGRVEVDPQTARIAEMLDQRTGEAR